jgi:hypothetical protein
MLLLVSRSTHRRQHCFFSLFHLWIDYKCIVMSLYKDKLFVLLMLTVIRKDD